MMQEVGKREKPDELTQVSDWGDREQATPLHLKDEGYRKTT